MARRENRNAVAWKVMDKKSGASGVLSAHRSQVSTTRTTDNGAKMMLICVQKKKTFRRPSSDKKTSSAVGYDKREK